MSGCIDLYTFPDIEIISWNRTIRVNRTSPGIYPLHGACDARFLGPDNMQQRCYRVASHRGPEERSRRQDAWETH